MQKRFYVLAAGLALAGCDSRAPVAASQPEHTQAVASQPRAATLTVRLAAEGGPPRVYQLPALGEVAHLLRGQLPPVDRLVGIDPESEFLYLRTPTGEIVAYDLESGRSDTVASNVGRATLGPDGTLYTVDEKRRVTSVAHRVRFAWPDPLAGEPVELFGAGNQRLVAVVRHQGTQIIAAAATQAPVTRDLDSGGDVAASHWGDMLAVAADSGVILFDALGRRDPAFVRLPHHPRALAFSPSGHRVYVARRSLAGLAVIDRFDPRELDGIALPAPAATIRIDPLGRWLVARPASGDSAWIVDLPIKRLAGVVATSWRVDLPAPAPDGSVLIRDGNDVVAVAVDSTGRIDERGRVDGAAADLWAVTRWRPRWGGMTAAGSGAADSAAAGGEVLYVQVSVSRNRAWSNEMAQQLTRAGLAARVLEPARAEEGFRVVLGPYPTRAEAEAIGRKLGRPFWIYQPE